MWLAQPRAERLNERRRHIAGPTGCGLCGIDLIVGSDSSSGNRRPGAVVFAAAKS